LKAYWIMLQEDTAGIALNFGADDVDGTISRERIAHAADARSPGGVTRKRLVRLIRDAGKLPVERDALYNEIKGIRGRRRGRRHGGNLPARAAQPGIAPRREAPRQVRGEVTGEEVRREAKAPHRGDGARAP